MLSDDIRASPQGPRPSAPASASREREMQEWAKTLGIAPARLQQAVSVVGITPRKIREYLRKNS